MHSVMVMALASPEGTITIDKLESSDTQTLYEAIGRSSLPKRFSITA